MFSESKSIPGTAASRIICWSVILSAYNYKIVYKKGAKIPEADAMSHLPCEAQLLDQNCNFLFLLTPLISLERVSQHTSNDRVLSKVMNYINTRWSKPVDPELKYYYNIRNYLSISKNCLFYGDRIVIPTFLQSEVLKIIHQGHNGVLRSKLFARSYVWWRQMNNDIQKTVQSCEVCQKTQKHTNKTVRFPWPKPKNPW